MLTKQYENAFSNQVESMKILNPDDFFSFVDTQDQFDSLVFDRVDILQALDKLSNNSAAGPDGILSILLKKCRFSLVYGLYIIVHKVFSSGSIPDLLKTAFIIPIHILRATPVYYRQVSLIIKYYKDPAKNHQVCSGQTS